MVSDQGQMIRRRYRFGGQAQDQQLMTNYQLRITNYK
jgi:hypothetical protein